MGWKRWNGQNQCLRIHDASVHSDSVRVETSQRESRVTLKKPKKSVLNRRKYHSEPNVQWVVTCGDDITIISSLAVGGGELFDESPEQLVVP